MGAVYRKHFAEGRRHAVAALGRCNVHCTPAKRIDVHQKDSTAAQPPDGGALQPGTWHANQRVHDTGGGDEQTKSEGTRDHWWAPARESVSHLPRRAAVWVQAAERAR